MDILNTPLKTKKRNEFVGLIRFKDEDGIRHRVVRFRNPMNEDTLRRYSTALAEVKDFDWASEPTMSGLAFGDVKIILNPITGEGELRIGYTAIARLFNHPVIHGTPVDAPNGQLWYLGAICDHNLDPEALDELTKIGSYVFPVAIWQGYTNK